VGESAIPGFPYLLLVRAPLGAYLAFVPLLIHPFDNEPSPPGIAISACALFVAAAALMQLVVVPIAIRASWRASTLRSWRPNLAIVCGCVQIAMPLWVVAQSQAVG
jgi:hypothetical protein